MPSPRPTTVLRNPPVRCFAAAVVATLLSACGNGVGGGDGGGDGGADGSASCAALLEVGGGRYLGHGDLRRQPETTGRRVDVVIPGCNDTGGQGDAVAERSASALELVGVPVGRAVLMDGSLYVRRGTDLPPAARAWFEPVPCDHAGEAEVTGIWLGVTGPHEPRHDGDLRPPYRLDVDVNLGPAAYVGATVTVHVTADTHPAPGPDDVRATLLTGGSVTALVRCDGDRFAALSVRSSRSAG